ncbi:MAG: hypothetical protein E7371_01215 [Clostridiales bacterium]|nr:hypothetical protein [Clostridiales bacterium]
MKKKWLTYMLGAVLAFGFAGTLASCNDGDSQSESISQSETSSEEKKTGVVHFDLNTDFQTNSVKDKTVTLGKRVVEPSVYILEENPNNLHVYGWYTDKDFTTKWDFKKDKVEGNMTLYARWVELFDVAYYVNGTYVKTENVFKGDLLEEDATIVEGFRYMGTYTNDDYEDKIDFTEPVTSNMDVFVLRSEGLYISDHTEEGELSSGTLTENLVAYLGTFGDPKKGEKDEEGWVEEYTVQTAYETGTVEEKCTYVNFGYTPTYGDGYVELCRNFDITQSQIIRIWMKNLGNAESVCMYFTTMLDVENTTYSETGMNYTQAFCYPNYIGNDSARITFTEDQKNMDESDEWFYVDFNLYEIYKNGYSVWGTSPFLGALRLQANYNSDKDTEDLSNVFLIKAIEGIPCDVPVEDSAEMQTKMDNAAGLTAEQLAEASSTQTENPNGFVFPKDYACVEGASEHAKTVNSTEGLLFYADNEILVRDYDSAIHSFAIDVPEGKIVDMAAYTTLHVKLCNYGYASNLIVYIYNNEGVPIKAELDIASRMTASKSYSVNLYGQFGMEGSLSRIEVLYTSRGVDNVIAFEEIYLGEFKPYDSVGINFNDKNCYGFTSNDQVDVSFETSRGGTLFNVKESGAVVTCPDKTYKATTDGYGYATLQYILYNSSNVTAVTVEYKIDGEFTTPYVYELNLDNKGKVNQVTLPFILKERGTVQALRLTFAGTGGIILKEISYSALQTGLPFYESYASVYQGHADWVSGGQYTYDESLQASLLTKSASASVVSCSLYIGYTKANNTHLEIPHDTYSVLVTETTKVKVVYQNRTDWGAVTVNLVFSNWNDASGEENRELPLKIKENHLGADDGFKAGMNEYEWSVLTIEVPTQFVGKYLSKVSVGFGGSELAIRSISIENGLEG